MGKKIIYFIMLIVALLIIDLYTFEIIIEDPGYYVVARRSERPRQVLDALNKIKTEKISKNKVRTLRRRFHRKTNDQTLSERKRKLWTKASEKLSEINIRD